MYNQNKYSDLIYQMIDGELTNTESSELFSVLGNSPEMQQEFMTALKINSASKSVVFGNVVPDNLTNSLFAKTGLNYTGSNTAVQPKITASGFPLFRNIFLGKYLLPVYGLIIGGLLSFFIFGEQQTKNIESYSSNENNELNVSIKQPDNYIKQSVMINKEKVSIPKSASSNIDLPKNDANDYDNKYVLDVNKSVPNNIYTNFEEISMNDKNLNRDFIFDDNYESQYTRNITNDNVADISILRSPDFALEINNSTFWNLPKESVYPSEIAKFHNMNIAAYYLMCDYVSLGLSARQETFYVKYNTTEGLEQYTYEQQPNLINIEASLRYYPVYFEKFRPYIQLNLGGGEYGYTSRFVIGNKFKIYENLSFALSLENAYLGYKHNNNWNISKKIGINYGINYSF